LVVIFGQRLKELRKTKGMTQRELADIVGINFTYLSKIENSAMPPPRGKTIVALAHALDADSDELFGLSKKIPTEFIEQINPEIIRLIRSMKDGAQKPVYELMRLVGRVGQLERELKHAREELGLSQQLKLFHALIENSQDSILVLDQDMELLYESPSAARLFAYGWEKLVGRDPLGFVHPDDLSKVANNLHQLAQNPGESICMIGRARRRDGTYRVIEAIAHSLVHIPAVNGIVVSMRDITDRQWEVEDILGGDMTTLPVEEYHLTESERQVLTLMAEGITNHQISERLVISPSTVRFHVSNILHKLGVTSRTKAVALAMRRHLVE
jgi:PAS domain S-box-containing protein